MSSVPINSGTYGVPTTQGATTSSFGSRAVAVSTVGYLCFGLAGWMVSMDAAGWFHGAFGTAILYPLSVILAIMGILGFVCGRGLDAIIFFTGATLFSTSSAYMVMIGNGKTADPVSYLGWYACLFAIFFGYIWAGSFRSGRVRSAFLLGTWLTLILAAIGAWTGATGFYMASGYIGLITAAIAMIVSANEVIGLGSRVNLNLESAGPTTVKPMAAD
jgi:succinate-acetate transporter protein